MAGTFFHEVDKLTMSRDIYDLSWQPALASLPKERCLATGYTCRGEMKQFEQIKPKHPLQALWHLL